MKPFNPDQKPETALKETAPSIDDVRYIPEESDENLRHPELGVAIGNSELKLEEESKEKLLMQSELLEPEQAGGNFKEQKPDRPSTNLPSPDNIFSDLKAIFENIFSWRVPDKLPLLLEE